MKAYLAVKDGLNYQRSEQLQNAMFLLQNSDKAWITQLLLTAQTLSPKPLLSQIQETKLVILYFICFKSMIKHFYLHITFCVNFAQTCCHTL